MKRRKCLGFIIIAAMLAILTTISLTSQQEKPKSLVDLNVEALTDGETGIGRICMLQPIPEWCVYYDPFEIFQGTFVSDPLIP